MAATFTLAFAGVPEPDLDRVAFSGRSIPRTPEDRALAAAFTSLGRDWQRRFAVRVIRGTRFTVDEAEEAVSQEVTLLIEKRRDVFFLESDSWLGLLFVRSRFRLLKNHSAPPPASTNAIEDALGDAALADARLCAPELPQAEAEALSVPLPNPGEEWSRIQVISGLQRFYRYYGRAPVARECRADNRLPSLTAIRHHFAGLEAALVAAGIIPAEHGRRRRPWRAVEAAQICESFRWRHGYWPNASDKSRHPELPSRSAMLRYLGSTNGGEIRERVEAILSGASGKSRHRA
jgi:hypothetical protein